MSTTKTRNAPRTVTRCAKRKGGRPLEVEPGPRRSLRLPQTIARWIDDIERRHPGKDASDVMRVALERGLASIEAEGLGDAA